MTKIEIAAYLDNALHHANSTHEDIRKICNEVLQYGFHGAWLNPCYVKFAKEIIGNKAAVGTVVSFPLGQDRDVSKAQNAVLATIEGADELDVSMNVGLFKEKQYEALENELKLIVDSAKMQRPDVIVKFIIETGYLSDDEIKKASELVVRSGADFIKTCSGYGPRGATINDVKVIREAVGKEIKVKVAGGIRTLSQALEFIYAGVDQIGTSSAVEIIKSVV